MGECITQCSVYDHVVRVVEAKRKLVPLVGYDTAEAGASAVDRDWLGLGRFIQEEAG
jgi:hypothetical protein